MSTLPRQAIRSIRTLHTTSRIFSDAPSKSLGFGDYTGRTRSLPTIDIPASSRMNVGRRHAKPDASANQKVATQNGPRQPRVHTGGAGSRAPGARKFPEKRERRLSKSPLVQNAKAVETAQAEQMGEGEGEGVDEFFTMSGDTSGSSSRKQMDVVDIDFSPERQISTKSRTNTKTRKGKGGVAAGSSSKRDTKGGRSTGSEPAKREDDRSSEGIFGRASLLFPLRRGARSAEQSIWAEGMKSEDARKAELERLIGKPTAYLPDVAYPTNLARSGKKVGKDSKDLASWIMATNPGISMRREKTGQAVLATYLK